MFSLAILLGVAVALQSAVNAKLRSFVQSPFLTSFISFTIGSVALFLIFFSRGEASLLTSLTDLPVWTFIGGLLGVVYLTSNIILFQKIGGVQTAVLPIFGQVVMGVLIDQFGLFYAPLTAMTWTKALGLVVVLCSVIIVTDLVFAAVKQKSDAPFIWKAVGVGAGMLSAIQAAVNGHLGSLLHSSIAAATISFVVGTICLFLLVIITKAPFSRILFALRETRRSLWVWTGGLLGAFYVFGIAFTVPALGAGQVIVLALFGQLCTSAIIEHFGLFGAMKKPVRLLKACALLLMLGGVMLMKL